MTGLPSFVFIVHPSSFIVRFSSFCLTTAHRRSNEQQTTVRAESVSIQFKFCAPIPSSAAPDQPAGDTLGRLADYLADDLEQVDGLICAALQSEVGLTNEIGRYLRGSSGKRLRPMLTLLASRIAGERVEATVHAAAVVELLHVASLLHDDVIDRASLRRGNPTVNAHWGNDVAILMADYIYSRAFAIAFQWLPLDLIAVLCGVAGVMCDGEMFQIEKREHLLTEPDYLYIIRCKTAELFSACTRMGAALGQAGETAIAALERYGLEVGCAFQITDDVLDLTADPHRLGKEIGTDIACGKQTLPLIHAIAKANAEDRAFLVAALNNSQPSEQVVERVVKYGGIEYALATARRHARQASECLDRLPDGPALTFLRDLTELVVKRAY
jgi:octaprenyl-diphosphate synthase